MSVEILRRRGTTAQHSTFVGGAGELTVDTSKNAAVLHDGATAGGFVMAAQHLAQTFVPSQVFANTENFFGNVAAGATVIKFLSTPGAGFSTLDFNANGTPDLNFLRKYNSTPFQTELSSSSGQDFISDANNNETSANFRFLTNGIRGSGTQTLLFTIQDNGGLVATGALNMGTNLINNVVNPIAAQDAATKGYVDTRSFTLPYRFTAISTTFLATDYTIDTASGPLTFTLPTAVGITGRIYVAKNSGGSTITLDGAGAELIDGQATAAVVAGASLMVQSTGAAWVII